VVDRVVAGLVAATTVRGEKFAHSVLTGCVKLIIRMRLACAGIFLIVERLNLVARLAPAPSISAG
jgi:hypothetical protein